METPFIRNFVIIAHVDHGKSTLADRLLEATGTIERRKMREQVLDQMELEREKGITIKMQPVRMNYTLGATDYVLNLIDTPGHIDFSYEVSRALKAVEGAVLLVDATQGVEAQTITVVEMARALGLTIIPVLNKIDLPSANVEAGAEEVMRLLHCPIEDILRVSGKTGEGVPRLLEEIVHRIPPPAVSNGGSPRALVFDFNYSPHRGVIVYVRLMDGEIKTGDTLIFLASREDFTAGEVGVFRPEEKAVSSLTAGEIGYVVTNIKKPSVAKVGDTLTSLLKPLLPLKGYREPRPVVWASVYPISADDFTELKRALDVLHLSDSALSYEEETSGALGRGFRCGFLGMLHLEIVVERLKREYGLALVVASPTVAYVIERPTGKREEISSPTLFPPEHEIKSIFEPWVEIQVITPPKTVGSMMEILYDHEAVMKGTEQFGENRTTLTAEMPLRELMRGFFDSLKSASAGYASLSYRLLGEREAPSGVIQKLDIYIAEEIVPAFSKIVSRRRIEREAEATVERLKDLIPRALFVVKVQAKGLGRIIAARAIPALSKNVTGHLYGGDRTRKMKLWQKQKKGKAKLKALGRGRVEIPPEVFVKMMQGEG